MTIQTQFDLYIAVVEMPTHLAFPDDEGEPSEHYGFENMEELSYHSGDGGYDSNFDDSSFAFESDKDDEGSIARILESYRQMAFGTDSIEAQPAVAVQRFFYGDDDSIDMANRRGVRRTETPNHDLLSSVERSTSIGDDDSLGLSRTRRLQGGVRNRVMYQPDDDDSSSSSEESSSSLSSDYSISDFDHNNDYSYDLPMNDEYEFVQYKQESVQAVPSKACEFEEEESTPTQTLSGLSLESGNSSMSSLPPLMSAADDDSEYDSDFDEYEFEDLVVPLKGCDDEGADVQRKINEQSQSRRMAFRNRRLTD